MALPPGTVSSGITQRVSLLAMTIDYVLAGFLPLPRRGWVPKVSVLLVPGGWVVDGVCGGCSHNAPPFGVIRSKNKQPNAPSFPG
jgi:hypothetical protein